MVVRPLKPLIKSCHTSMRVDRSDTNVNAAMLCLPKRKIWLSTPQMADSFDPTENTAILIDGL